MLLIANKDRLGVLEDEHSIDSLQEGGGNRYVV